MDRFPDDTLEELVTVRQIEVEVVGRRTGTPRRTTIWVVVHDGVAYVRSEYGDAGQWYRNVLSHPRIAVRIAGRRLDADATRVDDPDLWRAVSDAFRAKYGTSGSVDMMVRSEIEPMTLAFAPAG
jgi:deazaflavin-dependent oxidoreductase (nitroreductase family)